MVDQSWQVAVDHSTPSEWAEMVDLFDDANIYQTWSYGKVRWNENNVSHLVLRRNGDVAGIAQLRILRPTSFKFGLAYLRWGPLCERAGGPVELEVATRLAMALEEEYVGRRALFLRVLPNAFVGSSRASIMQSAFGRFTGEHLAATQVHRTIVLDLAPDVDQLRKSLDKKWRNQLAQAERNGLAVVEGTGKDQFETFCQMYHEMLKRKQFETTVDVEEFGRIQEDLPESQRMRILICEDKGRPVAGIVVSAIGQSAIYLLGATSDDGLKAKGAYLLQWTVINWLKENGFKRYDLGGIDPEQNPGVYHFKRGMSTAEVVQMGPQVACNSFISSSIVKTGLTLNRALHGLKDGLKVARGLMPLLNRS